VPVPPATGPTEHPPGNLPAPPPLPPPSLTIPTEHPPGNLPAPPPLKTPGPAPAPTQPKKP
jgi:hypothetical protein